MGFGSYRSIHGVGDAVAERLVETADCVVPIGDVEHVVRRPAVIKAVRPNAGHAALGHLFNFVIREQVPLIDHDGIEPRVVWTSSGRGVKKGHGLVQVVQDRRMILKKCLHLVARQCERHSQAIAIVVVGHILAPVNERWRILVRISFAIVVRIDHHVVPVDFQHRRNQDNDVLANRLDEGALFDCKPIAKLHQHFTRSSFRRVDRSRSPIQSLSFTNQLIGFGVCYLAGIGELCRDVFVSVQLCNRCFVSYCDQQLLLSFLTFLGRREHAHARSRFLKLVIVAIQIFRIS